MRLPARSAEPRRLAARVVSRPAPSTKVIKLKSTRSWRDRLAVVVAAFEIHFALHHHVDAVLGRHRHPAELEIRQSELFL